MSRYKLDIPSASSVNYNDTDEICGYQQLLCKLFEKAGGFGISEVSGKEIINIRREGTVWLREVKATIDSILSASIGGESNRLNSGDIPRLLASYDFLYRICYSSPCFSYARDITLKATDRWIKGDKSISTSQIALLLQKEINRDIRNLPQRFIDFGLRALETWTDDLRIYGRIQDTSQEDGFMIISSILFQNLTAFDVMMEDKLRWIETYSLSDKEIENLNLNELWTYMGFEQKAMSLLGKSLSERDARYAMFIDRISNSPDINRFLKKSIELDLARHETA